MSTSDIEIRLVDNMVCEIALLEKGEITSANKMLITRMEAMDRLWAMECLIAEDDSLYSEIITYLYEQLKELVLKLTIKL